MRVSKHETHPSRRSLSRPPQGEDTRIWVEVKLKPERRGAGEAQHHGFAPGRA